MTATPATSRSMTSIRNHIRAIGDEMLASHPDYPETALDKTAGIVPRCLIFDENKRDTAGRGSVVVGINPGFSDATERAYYVRRGCTYQATVDYWNGKVKDVPYYARLAAFLEAAGLHGPVLWTEVVHCELRDKGTPFSVPTIRDSIHRYLFRELEVIPKDWPLIAVGALPFPILAYAFLDRQIIGIPHPTPAHAAGNFPKLFSDGKLNQMAELQLKYLFVSGDPVAVSFNAKTLEFEPSPVN